MNLRHEQEKHETCDGQIQLTVGRRIRWLLKNVKVQATEGPPYSHHQPRRRVGPHVVRYERPVIQLQRPNTAKNHHTRPEER